MYDWPTFFFFFWRRTARPRKQRAPVHRNRRRHFGSSHSCSSNSLQQCESARSVCGFCSVKDVSSQFFPCRLVAAIGSNRIPRSEFLKRHPPSVQWPSAKSPDTKKTNPVAQFVQNRRVAMEYSPLPEEVTSGEGLLCVGRCRRGGETGIAECVGTRESQSLRAFAEDRRAVSRACREEANADSNILQAEDALKEARMPRVRRFEELEAGHARLETHCAQRARPVSGCIHTPCLEEGLIWELKSPACSKWSTSCKRSEMRSREVAGARRACGTIGEEATDAGRISWSTQWKSWCSGCTPGSRK